MVDAPGQKARFRISAGNEKRNKINVEHLTDVTFI